MGAFIKPFASDGVAEAFEAIKRRDFLPAESQRQAEQDTPLYIGYGQTNSQPYTVAFMLNLLDLKKGQKVLDVGSGSGWTTALLAQIVGPKGSVIGVEKIPELTRFGSDNLAKYRFKNAEIKQATNDLGWPKKAPYDRILVSASALEIPQKLVDQLKDGGIMVLPVGYSILKIKKAGDQLMTDEYPGFIFVPLTN